MRTYTRTWSGKTLHPLKPSPEEIELGDIAHGLSNVCRWGGQCDTFYPVAAHCLAVSDLITRVGGSWADAYVGLLHDASEAYICDIPKPLKERMRKYKRIELRLMRAIAEALGFHWPASEIVETADAVMQYTERQFLFRLPVGCDCPRPRQMDDERWAIQAREAFLKAANQCRHSEELFIARFSNCKIKMDFEGTVPDAIEKVFRVAA